MRARRLLFLALVVIIAASLLLWLRWRAPRFPHGIVIHHSASPMSNSGHLIGAQDIDRWHARRGFVTIYEGKAYHIGYHYVIRADGSVETGLPDKCRGMHASRGNDCLGICVIGDFSSRDNPTGRKGPTRPTRAQMAALTRLCGELLARHRLALSTVRSHREVDGDTECPGDRFPMQRLRSELRAR